MSTEEFVADIITASLPEQEKSSPTTEIITQDGATTLEEKAALIIPTDDNPAIVDLATQLGWKPTHAGENFVDAKTYILKSREIQDSMREHNKDLKYQLTNLQGSVDTLKAHNEQVYKAEVTRMQSEIDKLQKERKNAIEMADVTKVEELEKEIGTIEKSLAEPKVKTVQATNPIYDDWIQDNQWYVTNNDMAVYADTVAQQFAGAPLDRLYSLVRTKVAEVFPEAFAAPTVGLPNSGKVKAIGPASPVEAGRNQSTGKTFSKADLTPGQISVMNQFVLSGIMTEKQYISDIAKLKES